MESGLIFNQLNCEFESRHPCQIASLVQLVQDTALPVLRHRFDSGTMLQIFCSCSSTGRARRFERRRCGFESCQEFQILSRLARVPGIGLLNRTS